MHQRLANLLLPFKDKLKTKAEAFLSKLGKHETLLAKFILDSFTEYSVKIIAFGKSNESIGAVYIYYSPQKKSFRMSLHAFKGPEDIKQKIQNLWDGKLGLQYTTPNLFYQEKPPIQVFVDGSCIGDKISYGYVILEEEKVLAEGSGRVLEDGWIQSRQVGGELKAVMLAIEHCQQMKIVSIDLHYDYEGIEKWAKGIWKTNKPLTRNYKKFILASDLNIVWTKVKAHSGVKWNDYADNLAKKAIHNS